MPPPTLLSGILLAAATMLPGSAAPAAPREYQVFQTDHPPVMDGDLRDDIWRAVPWSGDFTGFQGAKADVETQFAMTWNEKFLYVAARCKEPKPEAIHADVAGRDPRIANDDHIEILIASSDDPTVFFRIFLNAGRGRMGQRIEEGRRTDGPEPANLWFRLEEAGLDSAARVQAGEWVVEAAIPLPKVEWPLKEGVAYVGNICRVRPAGAVREMAWNPVQRDSCKSAGFGVFKLCGPAAKARPIPGGDAILLRNGDRINGDLLGLADGKIRFSSPARAEEVSFGIAKVLRLDLAWTEAEAAPSRFFLNDGARISGKIAALSADRIAVESPSLGPVSIPLGLLSSIAFHGFSIESHFETGILKPWEAVLGSCAISDGVLHLSGEPRAGQYPAILSLPLHQDKTVTLIADYDPTPPDTPLRIQLFADRAHPQMQIQNGIMFDLLPSAVFAVYKDGQPVLQGEPRQGVPPGAQCTRIKVTYNPADGNATAWCNGKQVAEMTAPDGPKEGEYVVFGAARPLTIRRLAVYCGPLDHALGRPEGNRRDGLPAPDEPTAGPRFGEILAYLSNGDAVRARQIEFVDGNFIFTTEFGPMRLNLDRVTSLAFPAQAGKPPAAEGATAWVETSGSRFALEAPAITDEFVIGKSPELGEVKLPRRFVKSIAFPAP